VERVIRARPLSALLVGAQSQLSRVFLHSYTHQIAYML
jgi:hypothetical protein